MRSGVHQNVCPRRPRPGRLRTEPSTGSKRVRIERNREQLRRTQTGSGAQSAPAEPDRSGWGTGRSQVQILSPRSTRKAWKHGLFVVDSANARVAAGVNVG